MVLPGEDDEHVEAVPGLGQIRLLAHQPHGQHLDEHLDGEEREDEVVEVLEYAAADGGAHLVIARLVHAQRDAVQQDHPHRDTLEPCENG